VHIDELINDHLTIELLAYVEVGSCTFCYMNMSEMSVYVTNWLLHSIHFFCDKVWEQSSIVTMISRKCPSHLHFQHLPRQQEANLANRLNIMESRSCPCKNIYLLWPQIKNLFICSLVLDPLFLSWDRVEQIATTLREKTILECVWFT